MQETWIQSLGQEGNGSSLQYSCLSNPMDRRAGREAVHGVARELDMTEQLTNNYDSRFLLSCS